MILHRVSSMLAGIGVCLLVILCDVSVRAGTTFYVDASRPDDAGAGTSWATAKQTIQGAIDIAANGDVVLVTNGVYNKSGRADVPGDGLTNRVYNNLQVVIQTVSTNPADTIIEGAPDPDTGCCGPKAIRCYQGGNNSRLVGFTLTNGYTWAAGGVTSDEQCGGGARLAGGAHVGVLSNCVVVGNTAWNSGGGIGYGSAYNCVISYNSCSNNGGGINSVKAWNCSVVGNKGKRGGGGYAATFTDCIVNSNYSSGGGAGQASKFYNCDVIGNSSWGNAGAFTRTCVASNCVITGNTAPNGYGGCACDFTAAYRINIYNSLIADNSAGSGGACVMHVTMVNCTVVSNTETIAALGAINSMVAATNCIVYGNWHEPSGTVSNYSGASNLVNCLTWPDPTGQPFDGGGNITGDPGFVGSGSYHLRAWSPCVDTGLDLDNLTNDLDGVTRPLDGNGDGSAIFDMGCYEYDPPPKGTWVMIR